MLTNTRLNEITKFNLSNVNVKKTTTNNENPQSKIQSTFPDVNLLKAIYVQNTKSSERNPFFDDLTEEERCKINESNLDKQVVIQLSGLIKDGYADLNIFKNVPKEGEFRQNILNDINLVQEAKEKNLPLEDVYIPEYNSRKELYRKGTGKEELCCINGQLNYKTSYDCIPLKMDKKTYMKLFPPIKRYAINQQKNGDCYLISALTNIYNNPNTRLKILECFEQDGNDLKVKLPNSDNVYTIKNGVLDGDKLGDKEQYAQGAEWIRILEYVYGLECRNEYLQDAKDKTFESLDKAFTKRADIEEKISTTETKIESVEMLKRDLDEYRKIPQKNEFINEKIEALEKRISELNEPNLAMELEMYKLYNESLDLIFDENITNKEALYKALENIENIWINKTDYNSVEIDMLRNIQKVMKKVSYGITGIDIIKDNNKIDTLKNKYKTNINYYRDGGHICEAYLKLGLNAKLYDTNQFSNQAAKNQLINQLRFAYSNNNIIATATKDNITINKDKNIIPKHAYSIELSFNDDGEISYNIINPHNSAIKTPISEEELKENFKWLAIINN